MEVNNLGNTHMVIVDNASGDNSVNFIQEFIDKNLIQWVTVIASDENGGYAAGNNLAINAVFNKGITAERIWFLNPDTKVRTNAGVELIKAINENNLHIVGSRLEDEDGTFQYSYFNFPGVISELSDGLRLGMFDKIIKNYLVRKEPSNKPMQVDWLSGASFMVSKEYIQQIGLIDDSYFLYFEELDFCLQGNRNKFYCWYIPSSRVYHAVGASTGLTGKREIQARRPQYWFDSRRRFFLKNFGGFKLLCCDLAFITGYSVWLMRKTLSKSNDLSKKPPYFLRDFIRNSILFKGLSIRKKQ
jgi:GT2 family glycosyltransferase